MIHRRLLPLLEGLLWLVVGLSASSVVALPTDRQQPIFIEADRADMDDQKGISIYRGNVTLTQGSMALRCDVLTAHHSLETRELIDAVAEGAPAHFRQKATPDKEEVIATAPRMEYFVEKQLIYLLGNGEITQGRNVFRGQRIVYSLADAQVHAEGGTTPEGHSEGRVRITLIPRDHGKGGSGAKNTVLPEDQAPTGASHFLQAPAGESAPSSAPPQDAKP